MNRIYVTLVIQDNFCIIISAFNNVLMDSGKIKQKISVLNVLILVKSAIILKNVIVVNLVSISTQITKNVYHIFERVIIWIPLLVL